MTQAAIVHLNFRGRSTSKVVKEVAWSVVEVSHIVRAAKVTATLVAAGVAAQIAV